MRTVYLVTRKIAHPPYRIYRMNFRPDFLEDMGRTHNGKAGFGKIVLQSRSVHRRIVNIITVITIVSVFRFFTSPDIEIGSTFFRGRVFCYHPDCSIR